MAEAEYVAVIKEHCVAPENWIELALHSIEQHPTAVGGVGDDNGYDQLMDWAIYFIEYNAYMSSVEHGMIYDLCIANCIFR